MMNFKSKCMFIGFLLVCSCSSNTKNFSGNEKNIYGNSLDIGCLIGRPTEMVCIDSLLLFYDFYEKQTITVFDTKNNRFVRRFLNEGKGPGEAIIPIRLFVSPNEKKIFVFQIQTGYLYEYNMEDVANIEQEVPVFQKYIFEDRPAGIKKLKGGFIGIGLFDDGRFHLYSSEGKFLKAFGKYPLRGEEMDANVRFFVYQGFLGTIPDGNCLAMGSSYCDNVEFYRIENNHAALVKKYESYDVKAQFTQRLEINDDCVMNYKAAYGGDKYCYMLYSGKTYLENDRRTYSGKKVMVFDWSGNYVKSFEADQDIYSFCVDEANGILYAITQSEKEFNVTRYGIEL